MHRKCEKTGLHGLKTKAPFTLMKMFDMAQIKMVHVPKNIALMSCLLVFFSCRAKQCEKMLRYR